MSLAVWLIGLVVLAGVQSQSPSPPSAYSNIYRACVEDIAVWVTQGYSVVRPVIEVDPRILATPQRGLPAPLAEHHPSMDIAGVGVPDKVVVVPVARAEQCKGVGARTCRKDGQWVGVALEAPVVTGDTATVKVLVRVSRPPTEAELARARASRNPEAAVARYGEEAGGATLFSLSLTRKDGAWTVVARKIIGQS